mgnify:CR=1 FL=1
MGSDKIFEERKVYNDIGFIDTFLTEDFYREQKLFTYEHNEQKDVYEIESREFEKVKKMAEDISWLASAQGKVIKVISQLLADLPSHYRYKVLLIHREMAEVLASQQIMLKRRGQLTDAVDDAEIGAIFQRHIKQIRSWLAAQDHFEVLDVQYADILSNPHRESLRIAAYLGEGFDAEVMAGVVDSKLYRQRK